MLVISRKQNQKVTLTLPDGQRFVFTLLQATYGRARLGIEAPPEVVVDRTEERCACGRLTFRADRPCSVCRREAA